ncbi:MAG: GNAT family protein [Oscillospiraceae bacterium]
MKLTIDGDRLSIRPIERSDTGNIVRWRNTPEIVKNFIDRRPITQQSHQKWLETRVFTGDVVQFIITVKETGIDIGSVFLRDIDKENRHCEYGIFIGELSAQGKGYGTEACRLACGYAFWTLGMHRVFLRVLAENRGAVKSYEKAGFVQEGIFRSHLFDGEKYHDIIFMGILGEEFSNGGK